MPGDGCLPYFAGRLAHSASQAGTKLCISSLTYPFSALGRIALVFVNSISFQTTFLLVSFGRPATESECGLLPAKKRLAAAHGMPNALLAPPMGGYLLWHGPKLFRKYFLLSVLREDVNLSRTLFGR